MVHWLVYHAHHQVLICTIHGHAVLNLASHLADKHKDVDGKSRCAIVTEYLGLTLSRPPNADFPYGARNPTPAIDGLTVQRGFACGECDFVTTSWKRLRVHHGGNKYEWTLSRRVPVRWFEVWLQTFFTVPGNVVHYFCVTVPETDAPEAVTAKERIKQKGQPNCHLVDDIKEQWAHEKKQQEEMQKVLAEGVAKHETTNWLKRTGWRAQF